MKEKVVQCHGCPTCHGCPSALERLPGRINGHPDAAVRARGRFDKAPVQTVGAREITSAGGSALFVRTDVGREADIVALVEKTVGAYGALHIAFNNAGTEGQFGLLTTEQTVEHYHQICDINIRGVLLSMKHEIPAILRSGGGDSASIRSLGAARRFSLS